MGREEEEEAGIQLKLSIDNHTGNNSTKEPTVSRRVPSYTRPTHSPYVPCDQ